ncbi:MAG: alpha/beta hydrolase [Planctomycetaceae bacterium]|nr:alpha/beta hydrolase [Planctomycetaceae bacterium]
MSAERTVEPVQRMVEVNGHQIAVIDGTKGGSGPAIVFVHGILMSVDLWPRLIRGTFLDHCRWISVGLPGHHPSAAPENFQRQDVTEALFSDCLTAAIEAVFAEEQVHLVGWSTGGYAALMTVFEHPNKVKSVISLSGFVQGQWSHLLGHFQEACRSWWRGWMVLVGMNLVAWSPQLYRAFEWLVTIKRRPESALLDEVTELSYNAYRQHDKQVLRSLFAGLRDIDSSARLAEIQAPVLVLGGERDKIVVPAEAEHIAERLPHATLIQQSDVGHMFYVEGREQTLLRIEEWIRQWE